MQYPIAGYIHAFNKSDVTLNAFSITENADKVDALSIEKVGDDWYLNVTPKLHANGTIRVQWTVKQTVAGNELVSNTGTFAVHIWAVNDAPEIISVDTAPLSSVARAEQTQLTVVVEDIDHAFSERRMTATASDDTVIPPSNISIVPGVNEYVYLLYFTPVADTVDNGNVSNTLFLSDGVLVDTSVLSLSVVSTNIPTDVVYSNLL